MTKLTAFHHGARIAHGSATEVVAVLIERGGADEVMVFDDATGRVLDLDLRKPVAPPNAAPSRGRPRLGVTAREVTLLPRQWEWLAGQSGGASATLRRLVDAAQKQPPDTETLQRAARDAAYHFMQAIAGDLPGYEEALRSLYGHDAEGFFRCIAAWPEDIQRYARQLAEPAL